MRIDCIFLCDCVSGVVFVCRVECVCLVMGCLGGMFCVWVGWSVRGSSGVACGSAILCVGRVGM